MSFCSLIVYQLSSIVVFLFGYQRTYRWEEVSTTRKVCLLLWCLKSEPPRPHLLFLSEDFLGGGSPSLKHSTTALTGCPLSSCQICVVIAAVFGIVIYRVVTVSTFAAFKWALIRNNSQVATTGTAVCINFCIIMLLNVVSEHQGN